MQSRLSLRGPGGLELLPEARTCGGNDAMRFELGTERRRESAPRYPSGPDPAGRTWYCSRCRRPLTCRSLALGSLRLHSHSVQWNRVTLPSSLHT